MRHETETLTGGIKHETLKGDIKRRHEKKTLKHETLKGRHEKEDTKRRQ